MCVLLAPRAYAVGATTANATADEATVAESRVAGNAVPSREPASDASATPDSPKLDGEDAKLGEAKRLFREGNYLLDAGDREQALQRFLGSMRLVRSWQNTYNAAMCLEDLGRLDEALDYFEAALVDPNYPGSERTSLAAHIGHLSAQLSHLEVTANVDGMVVVDGRDRGKLPLSSPLHLQKGEHALRIIKDGYASYESTVALSLGGILRVDARLTPLQAAGRLRVELPSQTNALLTVDGADRGTLPWEGTLAPGRHTYSLEAGDMGTGLREVKVLQGQTVLERPAMKPLSALVRIGIETPGAEVSLDGVLLDRTWQGRLVVGSHEVSAVKEGYLPLRVPFKVSNTAGASIVAKLEADRTHPRWAMPEKPRLRGALLTGPTISSSPVGDASSSCGHELTLQDGSHAAACSSESIPFGAIAAIRASYRVVGSLGISFSLGYLLLGQRLTRTIEARGEDSSRQWVSRDFRDRTRMYGPWGGLGADYTLDLALPVEFNLSVGAWLATISASTDGTFSGRVPQPDAQVASATLHQYVALSENQEHRWLPFVAPEVHLYWPLSKHIALDTGIGCRFFLAQRFPRTGSTASNIGAGGRRYIVLNDAPEAFPDGSTARPGVMELPRESSLGLFWAITPTLGLQYEL